MPKKEDKNKNGIITDKTELKKLLKKHRIHKKTLSDKILRKFLGTPSCYLTGPPVFGDRPGRGGRKNNPEPDIEMDCYLLGPDIDFGDSDDAGDMEDMEPMCYDMGPPDIDNDE